AGGVCRGRRGGERDLASPPLRRTPLGLVVGCILGLLAVGGFLVYGIIRPGGATGWQRPGTLIVDKGTGTRYVLAAGRLHPVLNYASAPLLLGAALTVDLVPSPALAGVPPGAPVGIPGAPDALPPAGSGDIPWLVCAGQATDATGARVPVVSLRIGPAGDAAPQAAAPQAAEPLPDRQAVLV